MKRNPFDIETVKRMRASEPRETEAMVRLEATVMERDELRARVNAAELRGQDTGLALAQSEGTSLKARVHKLATALDRIEAILRDKAIGDDGNERCTRIAAVLDSLEVKT